MLWATPIMLLTSYWLANTQGISLKKKRTNVWTDSLLYICAPCGVDNPTDHVSDYTYCTAYVPLMRQAQPVTVYHKQYRV